MSRKVSKRFCCDEGLTLEASAKRTSHTTWRHNKPSSSASGKLTSSRCSVSSSGDEPEQSHSHFQLFIPIINERKHRRVKMMFCDKQNQDSVFNQCTIDQK